MALPIAFVAALSMVLPQDPPPAQRIEREQVVVALALAADGKRLALVGEDHGVALWHLGRREVLWQHPRGELPIAAVAAGEESVVYTPGVPASNGWRLDDGTHFLGAAGPGIGSGVRTTSIVITPKERWIWMGTDRGLVRVTPGSASGWSQRALDNGGTNCLAIDAKGDLVVAGGADGSLRFADAKSASVDDKKVFEAHPAAVLALTFDGKGKRVLSGAADGSLRVTTVANGKTAFAAEDAGGGVNAVAWDPRDRWFAVAYAGGLLRLHAARDGAALLELGSAGSEPTRALAVLDGGKGLAAACGKGVTLWDLSGL